jgi:hypothetical protein
MNNRRLFTALYLVIVLVMINVSPVFAAPPLRVTINQADTQTDPTNASPINFTVVFNRATTDFDTGDVTLSGTAGATTTKVTGSGITYNVAVSGMTGSGSVIANIMAGVAHDLSGTPNRAATYEDNSVTYDIVSLAVVIDLQSNSDSGISNTDNLTNAASPVYDVIFNKAITGFTSTDLSNIGSASECIFTVGTPSGFTYPVTVSSCSEGMIIVRLATGAIMDAFGNPNVQTDGIAVTLDRTKPVFSTVAPATGAFITSITTSSAVSYTLSEAIASGSITITSTSGLFDAASPHICTLIGAALGVGTHNSLDLSNTSNACTVAQSLVSGTVYSFAFNGTDVAGNAAAIVTDSGVTFDNTVPVVSWIAPVTDMETYYVSNESLQLVVNPSDNVGITEVVFLRWDYINNVRVEIGRATSPPYSFTFDTSVLLPGYNEIDVKAYDATTNAIQKYIWLYHLPVLTVTKAGSGIGKVTSFPAGIDCGETCSYGFADTTIVTLTAVPIYPFFFAGWSGAGCSGTGTCTVTMDSAKSVIAPFVLTIYKGYLPIIFR